MRTLISLLVLSLFTIGLPGLQAMNRPALAAAAHAPVQARAGKKKKSRPKKAPKTQKTKAEAKPKKNDRGFEL